MFHKPCESNINLSHMTKRSKQSVVPMQLRFYRTVLFLDTFSPKFSSSNKSYKSGSKIWKLEK